MKPIILTLIVTLTFSINLFGQNYQSINSSRITYFENVSGNIGCIRIDSINYYNTDSILYPFTVIQELDNCFSPIAASWIGRTVTIKENGMNKFINRQGDTISLKSNALFGDNWIAYQIEDSITIRATVISHDTITFLGLNDSVKTIGFQAFDKDMNPITMNINNMNVVISKNYGFIKTCNFYLFPDFQTNYPYEQFEEYNLVGLSNPEVGIKNLTWLEVNDFQVGDELHVLDESSCWESDEYYSATTNKAIYIYLDRTNYSDSIVYRFFRKQSIYSIWNDRSSFLFYNDTLTTTIKSDSLFDKLPREPIITDYETYNYYMTNELPLSKTNPRGYESFYYTEDSCWQMMIADGCFSDEKYIKGLGGPYYSCTQAFCLGGAERKLAYYKKGDITWGTPLVVTSISEIKDIKYITIFPNPAKNYIRISFENNSNSDCIINIYDIHGKLIKSRKLELNMTEINTTDLEPGTYFLKIIDNGNIIKYDKLIVE